MSDLLDRLEQALTDAEATARAAAAEGSTWSAVPDWMPERETAYVHLDPWGDVAEVIGDHPNQYAAHIAAWDPARVLGLVAGARKLLELHAGTTAYVSRDVGTACISCGTNDEYPTEWPCPTILTVAEMLGVEVPEPAQENR